MDTQTLVIGNVSLYVKDLEMMKNFYHNVVNLDIISESKTEIVLGKGKHALLELHHDDLIPSSIQGEAGLYHFAIVFGSRGTLARTIQHILTHSPQHFSGSGDHLVSEAFYFTDPEGNGIELYFDRDRALWQRENGQIKMATLYIDPVEYLRKYIVLEEPETEVKMGHVHLKVGDIDTAKRFYVDTLGFEIMAEMPSALFISVDGYHHHIGLNTWESNGAKERTLSHGLKRFEMVLSNTEDLENIKTKLTTENIRFKEVEKGIVLHDPWKHEILIKVA
ncbi:MAG: VOC family protein [Weeksellaceae bacterium]